MTYSDIPHIAIIKELVSQEKVVPVVGAGVSQATAGLPSWHDLVSSALTHAESVGLADNETVVNARRLLGSTAGSSLVEAAYQATQLLRGSSGGLGELPLWLKLVFDIPGSRILKPRLVAAILELNSPIIATTNMDTLLTMMSAPPLQPVTWREPAKMQLALQEGGRVLHLHGVWDDPESVTLGISDYSKLAENAAYRSVLQSLWLQRTLLFIGCSVDGITDPDFAALLQWASNEFSGSFFKHYALLREGSFDPNQAEEFLTRYRIQIVPYGPTFESLPAFLEQLSLRRNLPAGAEVPQNIGFVGRESEIGELLKACETRSSVLVYGLPGVGKSTLAAESVQRIRDKTQDIEIAWISHDLVTSPEDLADEIARHLDIGEVRFLSKERKRQRLRERLASRNHVIVVLDSIEPDIARGFAQDARSIGVGLIVTGRENQVGFDKTINLGVLDRETAIELFRQRSGDQNRDGLADRICSAVGDHPLAIVIAAGRHQLEGMPLDRLFDRLSDAKTRLRALSPSYGGDQLGNVKASLELSRSALSQETRPVLEFVASFPSEVGLEALALATGLSQEDCEDRVGRLVQLSLVGRRRNRFRMHSLVRDWVRQEIITDADTLIDRVGLSLAQFTFDHPTDTTHDHDALEEELANLVGCIRTAGLDPSEARQLFVGAVVRALAQDSGVLARYGYRELRHEVLTIGIQVLQSYPNPKMASELEIYLAHSYLDAGKPDLAESILDRVDEKLAGLGAEDLMSSTALTRGNIYLDCGERDLARSSYERSVELASIIGNASGQAPATGQLAAVARDSGDFDLAATLYEQALALYDDAGFAAGKAACLSNLGHIEARRGETAKARNLFRESLRLAVLC